MFKGKLTYSIAVLGVIWSFIGLYFGWLDTAQAINLLLGFGAVFGIRRAIE